MWTMCRTSKRASNWFDCIHSTYVLRLRLVTFWTSHTLTHTHLLYIHADFEQKNVKEKEVRDQNVWCDMWLLSRDGKSGIRNPVKASLYAGKYWLLLNEFFQFSSFNWCTQTNVPYPYICVDGVVYSTFFLYAHKTPWKIHIHCIQRVVNMRQLHNNKKKQQFIGNTLYCSKKRKHFRILLSSVTSEIQMRRKYGKWTELLRREKSREIKMEWTF